MSYPVTELKSIFRYKYYYIVGGNPANDGGGLIETTRDRYTADRLAATYVAKGYRNVRVLSEDEFYAE